MALQAEKLPIPQAYSSSGTGKTTAVHCDLGLLEADNIQFFRKVTAAKVAQICLLSSLPLVVDDPDTKSGFSSILIDRHNGGKTPTGLSHIKFCEVVHWLTRGCLDISVINSSCHLVFLTLSVTCPETKEAQRVVDRSKSIPPQAGLSKVKADSVMEFAKTPTGSSHAM